MTNILITDDCFVKGEPVEAGEVLKNVDNSTAAALLTSGRAVIAPKGAKANVEPLKAEKPKIKAAKKKVAKSDEG